jgi:branched-subunit amino acid ABC-type transport system permease component
MQKLLAILVDGTTYFSWLFIVSLGLTLTYGVMKILNIAHGSFYALGAYAASSAIGAYLAGVHPVAGAYLVLFVAGISSAPLPAFSLSAASCVRCMDATKSFSSSSPIPFFWCLRT